MRIRWGFLVLSSSHLLEGLALTELSFSEYAQMCLNKPMCDYIFFMLWICDLHVNLPLWLIC